MKLSFAESDLYTLYYADGGSSTFVCSKPIQDAFIDTVNLLRAMPNMECLLKKWRCLEPEVINGVVPRISVKVDSDHRLEVSYDQTFTELTIVYFSRVLVTI